MHLSHLALTNFRSFARLDLNVPRRLILCVGANAQGKTSILEAIYFLATFTSFQASADRQLVNLLAAKEALAVGRIVAQYERGGSKHKMEIRLILEANGMGQRLRKEILVDGVKRSQNEAIGQFMAVLFLPQMARIVEEGPEERRRYLNLALSQVVPGYATALSEYAQALTQRNALLKLLAERGGDANQLTFWDEIISSRGAQIIHARIAAVQELERIAARIHHRLSNGAEVLRLSYQPSFDPIPQPAGQFAFKLDAPADRSGISAGQIQQGLMDKLESVRGEEIARGVTTVGPHRDEVRFLANGLDLGDYGSRGQARTCLLALKMAEMAWMKEKTGESPVLLLDEIMSELDLQRRADLLQTLLECEQAILTTTDLGMFQEDFVGQAQTWQVADGKVV